MTARELAHRLAKYIGLISLDPEDESNTGGPMCAGMPDGTVEDIVVAINGGLQEIWDLAPALVRYQRAGTFLRAPTAVTVDVTQYSKTVAINGYASWMAGCSIRLGGEAMDNEVISGTQLLREYLGGTATGIPATIFHDCITLDANIAEVTAPIEIPQTRRLENAGSRQEFYCFDSAQAGGNDYGHVWARLHATTKEPGQPWAYFLDTEYSPTQMRLAKRMRFAPVPDSPYPIAFGARLAPPSITVEDIGTDTDPETKFPLPDGWDESVLLPMALQRYTAHPNFGSGNPLAAGEVARQYQIAKKMITGGEPNREAGRVIPVFR